MSLGCVLVIKPMFLFHSKLIFWINGCVVNDVYKPNKLILKGFECKTGCITSVTSLEFCTKRLENSHICENGTKS